MYTFNIIFKSKKGKKRERQTKKEKIGTRDTNVKAGRSNRKRVLWRKR